MCAVCEVEPCVVKFNYCKECKKDIQSCLNNAKADGKEDDFKRLSKTSAGLKHLIAHYKSKCPSRGQGVPRDKMDWVSYLSSVFTENRQVNGEKEVFMDFPDFEQFCKSKGKTAKDALEEWSDMEAQGRDHDFKGRKDFEKRFAVVTEEYRLKEKVNGDRQEPGALGRVCFFGECMCITLLCNFTWQWRLVSILDGVSFLHGRPWQAALLWCVIFTWQARQAGFALVYHFYVACPGRLVLLWCVIFTWQALAGWFFFGVSFLRGRPWQAGSTLSLLCGRPWQAGFTLVCHFYMAGPGWFDFGVSFLRGMVLLWCVIFTWHALAGRFYFGVSFLRGRQWKVGFNLVCRF